MRRRIVAPDGTQWRVGRRWLPDRPRLRRRGRKDRDFDAVETGADAGDLFDLGIFALFAVALLVVTVVLFPLVVLILEIVLVVLLAIAGLVGRTVGGRPWVVRARAKDGGVQQTWEVKGFRASGARRDEIAERLRSTGRPD